MAKKDASSPAPRTPGKTPPQKAPPIASIKKNMKSMSVSAPPSRFSCFDFNQNFMRIASDMTYFEDGTHQVYFNYLVNAMVIEHFNVAVSFDGLFLKLQAKVPKAFINVMARAYAKFNATYSNTRVIQSTLRTTIEEILLKLGPDFDNVWSKGQIEALPFACRVNPQMQLLWHEGNKNLCARNQHNPNIDRDAKHQMMPILRITAEAQEKQRKSTVCVEDLVFHRCSFYERGDSSLPPPPGCPYLSHSHQSVSSGDGFPSYAMGRGNTPTPTTTSKQYQHNDTSAFAFGGGGKTGNKKGVSGNGNNSTRKRKSPRSLGKNGADNDEEDASMELREEVANKQGGGIKNNIIDPDLFTEVKKNMNFLGGK
jgi:hypothetical protein